MKLKSRSQKRAQIIALIYRAELMTDFALEKYAFESGDFTADEISLIRSVEQNYERFKKLISSKLADGWTYDRLDYLERAILIWGAFELKINDSGLVIYELINYAKSFIPGDTYKFINSVLDAVRVTYEKIKSPKLTA